MKRLIPSLVASATLAALPLFTHAAGLNVGAITPSTATANVAQTYSATYSDDLYPVASCRLFVNGSDNGSMSLTGSMSGTATRSVTFTSAGTNALFARCTDSFGLVTTGATTNVVVSAVADVTFPTQPTNVQITTSSSDNTPTFTWSASSDNVAVSGYQVQLDGSAFAPVGNTTTYTASALANGSHTFGVRAVDAAGNVSAATSVSFSISAVVSPPATPPSLQPPFDLTQMTLDAQLVAVGASRATLEAQMGRTCEFDAATASARASAVFGAIADATMRAAIENFIGCGTISTRWLGAGERIGIVNSYRAAFGRLPSTVAHWNDVMKIGNGRFTAETSASAEAAAQVSFRKVYLRDAVMANEHDRNAITVMAYGLRPLPRNLNSEASAIVTFKAVYGHTPTTARDWDIVRAVAYSGATR